MTVIVESHKIPMAVIDALSARVAQLSIGCVWLRSGEDISEVFTVRDEIVQATKQVRSENGAYRTAPADASTPIDLNRDVWADRGNLICFARSAGGNAFCFDYSETGEPAIVWWTNIGWEEIASNPAEFLELLP